MPKMKTRSSAKKRFQVKKSGKVKYAKAYGKHHFTHAKSPGVASRSQHTLGKALDIRVEGVELTHLHKAALSLSAGGVGLYPVSNFVHVDVGPVRRWTGA